MVSIKKFLSHSMVVRECIKIIDSLKFLCFFDTPMFEDIFEVIFDYLHRITMLQCGFLFLGP